MELGEHQKAYNHLGGTMQVSLLVKLKCSLLFCIAFVGWRIAGTELTVVDPGIG